MDWPARIFEAVFLRQFLRLFFRTVFLCGFLEVPFFYEAAVPLVRVRAGGQVLDLVLDTLSPATTLFFKWNDLEWHIKPMIL